MPRNLKYYFFNTQFHCVLQASTPTYCRSYSLFRPKKADNCTIDGWEEQCWMALQLFFLSSGLLKHYRGKSSMQKKVSFAPLVILPPPPHSMSTADWSHNFVTVCWGLDAFITVDTLWEFWADLFVMRTKVGVVSSTF